MTRVKRGVLKTKTRRNLLKQVKGYRFGRSTKEASATEALMHAGAYAFAHRRDKKGDMRNLWNVKINAAVRPEGLSYSKLIDALHKKNIEVDRKILAILAEHNPDTFKRVVAQIK
ncbi:MAG: 50S ribosomal protein L20 [Candidatus Taylorbacteria bacterium RIFOXYD2_FULL_36_9]|uniref:Large ribosomal subunit protein bL20 n=1 Tax=Candidatus Taylorbacteria bacterium RIFOXYD2_FULL_36_9 TaxID=1802338 RepID=A0A1G2PGN3_9BACT|nr:MAG: 50S ribosomal protein L20 [Candidatus Taylorbacteria bacterium RIFOXYD2_FULL_36_9]